MYYFHVVQRHGLKNCQQSFPKKFIIEHLHIIDVGIFHLAIPKCDG